MKFPWEPFDEAAGRPSLRHYIATLRNDAKAINKAKREGLTLKQVDAWCERMDLVPWVVWPNWVDVVLADSAGLELFELSV